MKIKAFRYGEEITPIATTAKIGGMTLWAIILGQRADRCWEVLCPLSVRDFGVPGQDDKELRINRCGILVDKTKRDPKGNPRVKIIKDDGDNENILIIMPVPCGKYLARVVKEENAEVISMGNDIYGYTTMLIKFNIKGGIVTIKTQRFDPPWNYDVIWDGTTCCIRSSTESALIKWAHE